MFPNRISIGFSVGTRMLDLCHSDEKLKEIAGRLPAITIKYALNSNIPKSLPLRMKRKTVLVEPRAAYLNENIENDEGRFNITWFVSILSSKEQVVQVVLLIPSSKR